MTSLKNTLKSEFNWENDPFRRFNLENGAIIYGANPYLLNTLLNEGINVIAFLDIRANDIKSVNAIPVLHPDNSGLSDEVKENVSVLVWAGKTPTIQRSIVDNLKILGFKKIFLANDALIIGRRFYENVKNIDDDIDEILECENIFEDEISKKTYQGIIKSHIKGNDFCYVEPSNTTRYFDENIKLYKGYSRFFDCGAYTGDTLLKLNEVKGKVDEVVLFEPTISIYKEMVETLKKEGISKFANKVLSIPCGVSAKTEHLRATNLEGSSHVFDDGENIFSCITIDEMLPNFAPTFIKMDIEGSEIDAIIGAKESISQYKPDLGIATYHKLEHVWKIPLLIKSINSNYKIYLRSHRINALATTMYATTEC